MSAERNLLPGSQRFEIDRPLVNGGKVDRPPMVALAVILKDAVFFGVGRYLHGTRLIPQTVALILRKYCDELGIPIINAHSLRHLFCHDIIHFGGSAADVMNKAGHATLQSSTPYVAMFDQELRDRYIKVLGNRWENREDTSQGAVWEGRDKIPEEARI